MAKKTKKSKELQEQIQAIKESLHALESHYKEELQEKVSRANEQTKEQIASHPYQSVGIAFGAGALIGAFIAQLMRK